MSNARVLYSRSGPSDIHGNDVPCDNAVGSVRQILSEIRQELHAPLNAIIGFSEVLQGAAGQNLQLAKHDEYISLIYTAAMLLHNTLSNKLLTTEELEEHTALAFQPLNLEENLTDVFMMLEQAAHARGIVLKTEFTTSALTLNADKQKLQQLVMMLIMHAIEASQVGDSILVQIGKFAGKITFVIEGRRLMSDVNNQERKSIYLAQIVERIVEAHKGSISVDPVEAELERVVIKLPIGLKLKSYRPFNPANDIINLNKNNSDQLSHSVSIEDSIFKRKAG